MQIRVVSFQSPWVKDRLKNIPLWWGLPFEFDYYDTNAPIDMMKWGESLAIFDNDVVERWRDGTKDLTILIAPYQAPKNFLGFYLSLNASVRGICQIDKKVIQVFANETEHSFVNGVDQGGAFELYLNHELAHYFYLNFNRLDRTHTLFYSGKPIEAREEILTFFPKRKEPAQHLLDVARSYLGKDASPEDKANDERGCAESVSKIINEAFGDFPTSLSTLELYSLFGKHSKFKITLDLDPGSVILSPTGRGNGTIIGHVGIIGDGGVIMSNDSKSGLWKENYTLQSWIDRYRRVGGLPIYIYKRVT